MNGNKIFNQVLNVFNKLEGLKIQSLKSADFKSAPSEGYIIHLGAHIRSLQVIAQEFQIEQYV